MIVISIAQVRLKLLEKFLLEIMVSGKTREKGGGEINGEIEVYKFQGSWGWVSDRMIHGIT